MRRPRKIEHCEIIVESFLKDNPRFAPDGWFVQWCRMGNGGDPSNHLGPFREDQLYLNFAELLTTYPALGMDLMMMEGVETDDLFFPVIWGALLAYKKSDGNDDGWVYCEGKWSRMKFDGPCCRCENIPMSGLTEPVLNASFCKLHGLTETELEHGRKLAGHVLTDETFTLDVTAPELERVTPGPRTKKPPMYYHVVDWEGMTTVTICPVSFFDENRYLADSGEQEAFDTAMEDLEGFFEATDATFEFEGSVEEAEALLRTHSHFVKSDKFDEFMNRI